MTTPRLVTISFSHYCDKARWALDHAGLAYHEEAHLPGFHAPAVRRAGGKRTTPVLVTDEGVLPDSKDILAWADRQRPEARLYGRAPEERREIEALEAMLGDELGPHTRRWAYFHILPDRAATLAMFTSQTVTPSHERAIVPFAFPVLRPLMRRAMRIDAEGAERSRKKVDATFDTIAERLSDGRAFLVGDALSVADITFATLASPALLWEDPSSRLPPVDVLPPAAVSRIQAWRAHPAGQFALQITRLRASSPPR
ncbi:MAG: glutathione S-transferase [Sandaracinaceae bacterium]|nr:glutathione S-transferase [Sandaracinaceae bacterium]